MNAIQITEEQFVTLAIAAVKDESIKSNSMVFLRSTEGLLIQNAAGEYFLIENSLR